MSRFEGHDFFAPPSPQPNESPLQQFMRLLLEFGALTWWFLLVSLSFFKYLDPTFCSMWTIVGTVVVCTLIYGFIWWVHVMLSPYDQEKKIKSPRYISGKL